MVWYHPFGKSDTFYRVEGYRRIVCYFDFSFLNQGRDLISKRSTRHMILQSNHFKVQKVMKREWSSVFKHQTLNMVLGSSSLVNLSSHIVVVMGVIVNGCSSVLASTGLRNCICHPPQLSKVSGLARMNVPLLSKVT